MKTVITYGTYDMLHYGHIRFLNYCRSLGDRLVVGVSTDDFNRAKGKESFFNFADRCGMVSSLRCVDEVFPEYSWGQKYSDIQRYSASVFCIGEDWAGSFDELKRFCEVLYVPRTEGISTTKLKGIVK